jgi:cytochrome c biogenesis protein CcmG, thiol:disulfide interchange protein DsbE
MSRRVLRCCFAAALLMVAAGAQTGAPSLVNRKAPEFARKDLRGQAMSAAQLRGKVVLLNFWATWCAPCQLEMPAFAGWQRQYGPQGLAVVGISMDDGEEPVRKLTQKLKIDYPVAMGDAALGKRYGGVLGLPETFLIDRSGVVRAQFQGEVDLKKIEASLKNLLNAQ